MSGEPVVWRPEPSWTVAAEVIGGQGCRYGGGGQKACGKRAVAALARPVGAPEPDQHWWCYCEEHLYGRKLRGGVVWGPFRDDEVLA